MRWDDWAEVSGFILLVIGFFVALAAQSAAVSYLIILFVGMMGGRVWFRIKKNMKLAWVIILAGFLIGFVLGSLYGDNRMIILLYIIGIGASYYVHDKGLIKSTEY